jgi:amidase
MPRWISSKLDALIAPTGSPAWTTDLLNGATPSEEVRAWQRLLDIPTRTLPMGLIFGLPIGTSFFGRARSEPKLIKLAYAFEQATKARRRLLLQPTANLVASA